MTGRWMSWSMFDVPSPLTVQRVQLSPIVNTRISAAPRTPTRAEGAMTHTPVAPEFAATKTWGLCPIGYWRFGNGVKQGGRPRVGGAAGAIGAFQRGHPRRGPRPAEGIHVGHALPGAWLGPAPAPTTGPPPTPAFRPLPPLA